MSTKIHHGHRLAAGAGPAAFLAALPAVMAPVRDRLDAASILRKALERIDGADRRGVARPGHPAADALAEILAEEADPRNAGTVWESWNEVTVSHGTDPGTGRTMILIHASEGGAYFDALRSMPEVEPYPYWNNADRPDDVDGTEWDERKAAWDRTIPRRTSGSQMGSWQLESPAGRREDLLGRILSSEEELALWAPTFDRASWVALNTFSEWLHSDAGLDLMDCTSAAFRADLSPLTAVIGPALVPLTRQLFIDGTGVNRLHTVMDQVRAACSQMSGA